ncbi:MAG: ATP-dependent Clp protease ATP-binding subunit [Alphaproteobacteria bacterium]|nr:ATP-dependent Clp protease ATP-binding subunit [Alphaproteobacteria bacterium]
MNAILQSAQRWLPFVLLASLAISAVQLALALGLSAATIDGTLRSIAPAFAAAALLAWMVVLAGLVFEAAADARPSRRNRKNFVMDVLERLTNRAALEAMLAAQKTSVVIDAEALATRLKSRVVGQDAVCDDVAAQIRRRLALAVRGKPVGVFLFAGPPGTGKTWLAKQIADALDRKLLHFDMTQFSSLHAATQLFGSPKGYVGSDSYGRLTGSLKETPDAVVLLDEIEKAHPDVLKKFLVAWNDGHITEASDGQQVSTTGALFVLTTNAASAELAEFATRHAEDADRLRQASVEALGRSGFAPEVLNRIDRIFVLRPLQGLDIARVGAMAIETVVGGYDLEIADGGIDPTLLFELMQRHARLGPAASARDLARVIEETISDDLIDARQKQAKRVKLVRGPDRVLAEIVA